MFVIQCNNNYLGNNNEYFNYIQKLIYVIIGIIYYDRNCIIYDKFLNEIPEDISYLFVKEFIKTKILNKIKNSISIRKYCISELVNYLFYLRFVNYNDNVITITKKMLENMSFKSFKIYEIECNKEYNEIISFKIDDNTNEQLLIFDIKKQSEKNVIDFSNRKKNKNNYYELKFIICFSEKLNYFYLLTKKNTTNWIKLVTDQINCITSYTFENIDVAYDAIMIVYSHETAI